MKKINVINLVKKYEQEIISDIADMVAIPSFWDEKTISSKTPYGQNIANAFVAMTTKAKNYGLTVNNIDNRCLEIKIANNNLQTFGIMSHLDTVPVTNSWKTDPFVLTQIGDKFYGRGSSDDKGPSIMVLWALKLYKELNLTPKYDIVCLFGGDEERGSSDLKHYFSKNKQFDLGFSPDSDFPIIYLEKSYTHYQFKKTYKKVNEESDFTILKVIGGTKINVVCDYVDVQFKCKNEKMLNKLLTLCKTENIYFEQDNLILNLNFEGLAAHAKHPQTGINAIWKFAKFCAKLNIDKNAHDFVKFINNYFCDDVHAKKLGIFDEDEHTFSTNNLALINYKDNKFSLDFNYRSTLSTNLSAANSKLTKLGELFSFNLDVIEQDEPHFVDKDSDNIKILKHAYKTVMNETIKLGVNGGRTYAASCKNTVSFGPLFKSDEAKIHSDEESLSLQSILKVTAIYLQVLIDISLEQ